MVTRGLREFVARSWSEAREAKDAYWAERIRRLGPLEALRISDELRLHMRQANAGWPGAEERQRDLDAHLQLADRLHRAHSVRRR